MVKAGLPILQVLEMLRDQVENPAMGDVIEDIRRSLEGGISLSKSFEKYPDLFDSLRIWQNVSFYNIQNGKNKKFCFEDAIINLEKVGLSSNVVIRIPLPLLVLSSVSQ